VILFIDDSTPGGGGGDPSFASVKLLSNFQGTNGSTTFTDQSPVGRTMTAAGNAQIKTDQFIFGTSSAYFDGSGDYVDCGTGLDLSIDNTTSWTEEFWFRPDESNYAGGISSLKRFGYYTNGGGETFLIGNEYYSAAAATRRVSGGADNNSSGPLSGELSIVGGTWYFMQAVNDAAANTFKLFMGTAGSGTGTQIISTTKFGRKMRYLGAAGSPGLDYFKGYLGPYRLTVGVARANAVPTALFPTS
jgi:hypothetical protein